MTKKEIRREVKALCDLNAEFQARLEALQVELHNRPAKTRGEPTSVRLDEVVRQRIVTLHETHPTLPQHEIARMTGVNPGRVSETLAGKRV